MDKNKKMYSTCKQYYSCSCCPYNPEDNSKYGTEWKGGCPNYDRKLVYAMAQGYRKIQDNEIVITKEEYESLKKGVKTVSYQAMINESDQQHWLNGYKVGYRDGVNELIREIAKIKTELIGESKNEKPRPPKQP